MNTRRVVGLALAWTALTGCATGDNAAELTDAQLARIAVDELGDFHDDAAVTDVTLLDEAQDAIGRARDLHDCKISGLVVGLTSVTDDGFREFDGRWIDLSNRHMNGHTSGHGYAGEFEGNIEGRMLDGWVAGAYGNGEFAGRWEAVRYGWTDGTDISPGDPTDPDYTDVDGDPSTGDVDADGNATDANGHPSAGDVDPDGNVIDADGNDNGVTDPTWTDEDDDGIDDTTGEVIQSEPPVIIDYAPDSFHQGFVIGDYSTIEPLNVGYFFGAWAECEPLVLPVTEPCDDPTHTHPDGTSGSQDGTEPAGDSL
jgi:hypothetical protein